MEGGGVLYNGFVMLGFVHRLHVYERRHRGFMDFDV
jgi:hypothetical protein